MLPGLVYLRSASQKQQATPVAQ